jgi:hypothetical protein
MLVAFLKEERAAAAYQAAVARVFHHFYRHDLLYSHAQANCAGLSLDTFHAVGWNIPPAGATSHLKALLAWPYVSLRERSLSSGRSACQYYCAERTRLLPAMAFEAAGTDLMRLTAALAEPRRPSGRYESWLASDVEAIAFVHIPQIPSSRVLGSFAVASLDEYLARTPKDRSEWRTIPTRPRPFPAELAD